MLLNRELELYRPELLDKPSILVANKQDTDADGQLMRQLMEDLNNLPQSLDNFDPELKPERIIHFDEVLSMSAKEKDNTQNVMEIIRSLLDEYAQSRREEMKREAALLKFDEEDGLLKMRGERARRKVMWEICTDNIVSKNIFWKC